MAEILAETTAPITEEEYVALFRHMAEDDFSFESSTQAAHVHVRRLGAAKSGKAARVMIAAHDHVKAVGGVYTAAEARQIAARLLDLADEIDGVAPLVFMPEGPSATHPIEGDE